MRVIPVAVLVSAFFGIALAGCKGGSDPKSLCEKIYKERVDGKIIPFREVGPKHEKEFKAHCATLPVEYLQCEAKDLFSMAGDEMKRCRQLIEQHQAGLNNVLMTGKPQR